MTAEPLLWQQQSKHKPAPKTGSFTLTQGNGAWIDTHAIPKDGQVVIEFPGCTTVTIFQAFNSPAAQAVWNANQGSNPLFAPNPPVYPNTSSLMVIADALGNVEVMTPFNMGTKLKISNAKITGGSEYVISARIPDYKLPAIFMDLKSPDISVGIPNSVYGGNAGACQTAEQQVQMAAVVRDYINNKTQIRNTP